MRKLSQSSVGTPPTKGDMGSKDKKSPTAQQNADDFDDISDNMFKMGGEDFGFGFDEDEGDPNVRPKDVPVPESDPTTRSSDSISLTWKPIKQLLTKLVLQCQLYNAKKVPFETFDLTKSGNKQVDIHDAPEGWSATVSGLTPESLYVFRLIATNPAGTTQGPSSAPIETYEFSPPRGDKSGYLLNMNLSTAPKTLGRRLSFKKDGPERYWYVLDGLRLGWHDTVDGKEIGTIHFKDVAYINTEDANADGSTVIVIQLTNKTALNLIARSNRPDVTNAQYCKAWVVAFRKAKDSVSGTFGSSTNTGMIF